MPIIFPITSNESYFLEFSNDLLQKIKTNILSLLLTKKYTRVMQAEIYSPLYEYIFEKNYEIFEIKNIIKNIIEENIPIVLIKKIDFNIENEKENAVDVKLSIVYDIERTNLTDKVEIIITLNSK